MISEDLMHLFWNMGRLMSLTELSIKYPFRTQTDKSEWGLPARKFPVFKVTWEDFILHPRLLNLENRKPGMCDFEYES